MRKISTQNSTNNVLLMTRHWFCNGDDVMDVVDENILSTKRKQDSDKKHETIESWAIA